MFKNLTRTQEYGIHILFWISYYVLFGFIWARGGDYWSSFYLEFVYMPVRLMVAYATILYLIPQFLITKKFREFSILYLTMLVAGSIVQRLFFYFFFEGNTEFVMMDILDINALIRTAILLNSTVLFVSSVKIMSLYFEEKDKTSDSDNEFIELKSNRKIYRVLPSEIYYIEGMGNYVVYHVADDKKIIVYQSLKKTISLLDENFVRVHKSYIVNKNLVSSYDSESLELTSGDTISVSKNLDIEMLLN